MAQALLPVRDAGDAPGLGSGKSACAAVYGLLLTGRNLLSAVDDGQHVDLIGFEVVDNPERPFHNLTNLRDAKFCHLAPGQGELGNLLRAPGQAINQAQGVLR